MYLNRDVLVCCNIYFIMLPTGLYIVNLIFYDIFLLLNLVTLPLLFLHAFSHLFPVFSSFHLFLVTFSSLPLSLFILTFSCHFLSKILLAWS